MQRPQAHSRRQGFTLVELLVVIGIIGVLIAILLPALNKARQQAKTLNCLANLKTLGNAMIMYANEHKGWLPYPTTTLFDKTDPVVNAGSIKGEPNLWYNCVDPYLQAHVTQGRTGVAASRTYKRYKQCVVWDEFVDDKNTAGQNNTKESARTYKMNSNLRRKAPGASIFSSKYTPGLAKITDARQADQFVMIGDGLAMDMCPPQKSDGTASFENAQFSFEVNDATQATPALRHGKDGANILFVDGHAATFNFPTKLKSLSDFPSIKVKTWPSEYLKGTAEYNPGSDTDSNPGATMESLGLTRNPAMPLRWSIIGKLYR